MPAAGLCLFYSLCNTPADYYTAYIFRLKAVLTQKQWNINQKSWTIKRSTKKNKHTFLYISLPVCMSQYKLQINHYTDK